MNQLNADLIRHPPLPTMTKVTTMLPVHAPIHIPTARVQGACTSPYPQHRGGAYSPFTHGASCLSSDSTYPITQPSPWRMPLILTIANNVRAPCPHLITIKLHAHNLQSTSATVHALHFHCLPYSRVMTQALILPTSPRCTPLILSPPAPICLPFILQGACP